MMSEIDLASIDAETARTQYGALLNFGVAPWRHGLLEPQKAVTLLNSASTGEFILSNTQDSQKHLLTVKMEFGKCSQFHITSREQSSNLPIFMVNGDNVGEFTSVEDLITSLIDSPRQIIPVKLKAGLGPMSQTAYDGASTMDRVPAKPSWQVGLDEIAL